MRQVMRIEAKMNVSTLRNKTDYNEIHTIRTNLFYILVKDERERRESWENMFINIESVNFPNKKYKTNEKHNRSCVSP